MQSKTLYDREYYLKHKDKKKAVAYAWYHKYLTKAKESRRKWTENHPEETRLYKKKYYQLHKTEVKKRAVDWYNKQTTEKKREIHRKVYSNNPGKYTFYSKRRVRLKKQAGLTHSFEEWQELLKKLNYTCVGCGQKNIKLEEDHIIPLIKGGSDHISNIQPLCGHCNRIKSAKLNFNFDVYHREVAMEPV